MIRVVDVCTRVEGHGNVKILIHNDDILNVEFEVTPFRGFEKFLIGKKLVDIPRIISRLCGLCYASQSIVSCKAIEDIYGIEISEQTIFLRQILQCGEMIKSHSMHFFFQSLPDLLKIYNICQNIPSLSELTNFDPEITSKIYDLINIGNEIERLFGGRSTHLLTIIPGGIVYQPSEKKKILAKKFFHKALSNIDFLIRKFIDLFSNYNPPSIFFLQNPIYLSQNNYGKYDRYSGILTIKENKKNVINFQKTSYSSYFDKEFDLRGIENKFSIKSLLVGPLARYKIIENYGINETSAFLESFDKSWQETIIFSNFLRLIEMFVEINKSLKIIEGNTLIKNYKLASLGSIRNFEGIGVVEAPRGTLIHHYYINEKKEIENIKLFIATEINIPLINNMITQYSQKLYQKTGDLELIKRDVQMIIRAFDPCISCATY